MKPKIEFHIEELVLYGFKPGDGPEIGEAIERKLAHLFRHQGVPTPLQQGGDLNRLDGGSIDVAHGSRADGIGSQVAQAVYEGFGR